MINLATSPLQVGRECILRVKDRELVVEILGMAGDAIWVSFPCMEALEEGIGVEIIFDSESGHRCYHTRVAVSPSDASKGIMLERSETADGRRTRRDWRVPTDLSIWVREPNGKEKIEGRLLNLTNRGALVSTNASLEAGEVLEMLFQLPETSSQDVMAQVVYSDKSSGGVHQFGIRFVNMKKEAREAITWYLYDQIQQMYGQDIRDMYPRNAPRKFSTKLAEVAH